MHKNTVLQFKGNRSTVLLYQVRIMRFLARLIGPSCI